MTPAELDEIEKRANAATKGPWKIDWYETRPEGFSGISAEGAEICCTDSNIYGPSLADAEFIAHAREDIPKLIAEVRLLERLTKELMQARDDLTEQVRQMSCVT